MNNPFSIIKEQLQPPSQEATQECIYIEWSLIFDDIFFYYKRTIAATQSFKFTVFAEQELQQEIS